MDFADDSRRLSSVSVKVLNSYVTGIMREGMRTEERRAEQALDIFRIVGEEREHYLKLLCGVRDEA